MGEYRPSGLGTIVRGSRCLSRLFRLRVAAPGQGRFGGREVWLLLSRGRFQRWGSCSERAEEVAKGVSRGGEGCRQLSGVLVEGRELSPVVDGQAVQGSESIVGDGRGFQGPRTRLLPPHAELQGFHTVAADDAGRGTGQVRIRRDHGRGMRRPQFRCRLSGESAGMAVSSACSAPRRSASLATVGGKLQ